MKRLGDHMKTMSAASKPVLLTALKSIARTGSTQRRLAALTCLFAGILASQAGFATNGYFPHGMGTKNKAMAGAGMARPQDAIDIVNNPAVAAFLHSKLKGGGATFDPDADGPLGIENLPGIYGDGDASLDLARAYVDPTYAKKWGENTAWGVSAVLAAQSLELKGTDGLARYTQSLHRRLHAQA